MDRTMPSTLRLKSKAEAEVLHRTYAGRGGMKLTFKDGSVYQFDKMACAGVRAIGKDFMECTHLLLSVSMAGMSNVTTVDNNFLGRCIALKAVDLSGLTHLTSVGDYFLGRCAVLSSVNFSGLRTLRTVGNNFLFNTPSLRSVDVTLLDGLTNVGHSFLLQCAAKSVELRQRSRGSDWQDSGYPHSDDDSDCDSLYDWDKGHSSSDEVDEDSHIFVVA